MVIEIGAGSTIPSVREFSQAVVHERQGRLVRINATEAEVPSSFDVSLLGRGLPALIAIQERWRELTR